MEGRIICAWNLEAEEDCLASLSLRSSLIFENQLRDHECSNSECGKFFAPNFLEK